jgi:hypothetical protein
VQLLSSLYILIPELQAAPAMLSTSTDDAESEDELHCCAVVSLHIFALAGLPLCYRNRALLTGHRGGKIEPLSSPNKAA